MKPTLFLLYQSVYHLYDTPTGTAETMLASFVYMIHRLVQQKQCWLHCVSYRQMKPTLFLLYQSVYHIDKWSQHCFCCTSQCVITAETMLASFVYMIHRLVQQKQCWLHLSIWYTDWYSRNNAGFICLYDAPTGTAETMLASFVYMIHPNEASIVSAVPVSVSYRQMKPTLLLLYQSVCHINKWSQHCFCCLHLSIWCTDWYSRNNVGFICLYDTPTGTAETMLASFVYSKWSQHCFCCTSQCVI
jgi:hypothetical protein